ncbi:ECF transporter S component [Dendrosporobacter sp. 1207_IL3150]|uniref:ECF transporter S component n=1 Tax=Dendrosporobacter sp. 1207_IL3150 TaxID=3084054 RepID=UPI002FD95C45
MVQKKSKVRKMAVVGMLSAICVILGLTGYGFIPLPMAKATIMHIPVIIGAILEGPIVGMLIGLIFGLFSIFQNMATPNVLSFAFINPLVSVVPRIMIGLTAYYSYKLISAKRESLGIGVGAAIGSLTNTIGVLGMIYILYAADFAVARGINPDTVFKVISGIAVMNGVPEAIISTAITVPVVLAVKRVK